MNFYALDFEEQVHSEMIEQNLNILPCEPEFDYESEQQLEHEKLDTFDGYLQEEPVIYFNYVEEAPKKKNKPILKRSKKIKKSDAETDFNSSKKSTPILLSNDLAKLQQCQMLKTMISQMENILQQTRTQILGELIKQQQPTRK